MLGCGVLSRCSRVHFLGLCHRYFVCVTMQIRTSKTCQSSRSDSPASPAGHNSSHKRCWDRSHPSLLTSGAVSESCKTKLSVCTISLSPRRTSQPQDVMMLSIRGSPAGPKNRATRSFRLPAILPRLKAIELSPCISPKCARPRALAGCLPLREETSHPSRQGEGGTSESQARV